MGDAAEKRVPVWLTTAEAAEMMRTTPGAVLKLVARGRLVPDCPAGLLHGHRFKIETIERLLKGGSEP